MGAINKSAHIKLMNCLYRVLQLKFLLLLVALAVPSLSPQIHMSPPTPFPFVMKSERSPIASDLHFTVPS